MDPITLGLDPLPKKTRNEVFLEEMNQVAPWSALAALIQPHARGAHRAVGRRLPFAVETMLRIYCLHLSWNLTDPAMEVKDSKVSWEITMRPSKRRALDPERQLHQLLETVEKDKASIGANVEHHFRIVKQQFGYAKVRYRGLIKNTARLTMLFALANEACS